MLCLNILPDAESCSRPQPPAGGKAGQQKRQALNLIVVPNHQKKGKRSDFLQYEKLRPEEIYIPDNDIVTVTYMGKVTEITHMTAHNSKPRSIKVSADEYMVTETGEVKKYANKSENRSQSESSIRKTMRRIRELIQTNVTDPKKVRWITLTYRENMTDTKRLYEDFRRFNQRFIYQLTSCGIEKPSYIGSAEAQGRGSYHWHCLYIWKNSPAPFIHNDAFADLWGHGFTKIKALKDTDNIANYLMCYLTDVEIAPELKGYFPEDMLKEITSDQQKKSVVKGGRLHMYPANFNIIRHSNDIKYPEKVKMPYKEALQSVKGKRLKYETAFRMTDGEDFENIVDRKEYIDQDFQTSEGGKNI